MSIGSFSNSGIKYNYTTIPTFTSDYVGYISSASTTNIIINEGAIPKDILNIVISNSGIYICEASLEYAAITKDYFVWASLNTTSATMNISNQVNAFTSNDAETNLIVRTTNVIALNAGDTLYCIGKVGSAPQTINYAYMQITRIA